MISCDCDLASWHGFKKCHSTHQLAQLDMGITNAGIYYFEGHPELKNKEGQRRKFNEISASHFTAARSIDWELLYGNSIIDLDSGKSRISGNDSDNSDVMNQLGVQNMRST
jgi:hypothetical protein